MVNDELSLCGLRETRTALSATSPRSFLAVGFPLLSLAEAREPKLFSVLQLHNLTKPKKFRL